MQRDCAYMLRESYFNRNRRNGEKDLFPWISYRRRSAWIVRLKLLFAACMCFAVALALVKAGVLIFG
jgi:hypothetical protein